VCNVRLIKPLRSREMPPSALDVVQGKITPLITRRYRRGLAPTAARPEGPRCTSRILWTSNKKGKGLWHTCHCRLQRWKEPCTCCRSFVMAGWLSWQISGPGGACLWFSLGTLHGPLIV
jgi:hypothetical protein